MVKKIWRGSGSQGQVSSLIISDESLSALTMIEVYLLGNLLSVDNGMGKYKK